MPALSRPTAAWRQDRIDPFEVAVFMVLAGLSVWLLGFLLAMDSPTHVWTGTDGPPIGDQMQYLGWIQQAARHLLISDPFTTAPTSTPGAVLAPENLGEVVPAETGRKTWVGIFSWTPDYARRVNLAGALFAGELSPAESVELEAGGARFLVADCQDPHDLSSFLRPVLVSARHFGCATVYQVAACPH